MKPAIENLRTLNGMGILADRDAKSPSLSFRKYNLIYGFNGSGKSTLSRLFASLEEAALHHKLPESAAFEVMLDDKTILGCPEKPNGLERRILVFNADYVERNLQWSAGLAKPVFFIGTDQAEAAAELEKIEAQVSREEARKVAAENAQKIASKGFANFKRDRAKITAAHLHLGNRKYEAPTLVRDYEAWVTSHLEPLSDDQLKAAEDTRRLAEPLQKCNPLEFDAARVQAAYKFVTDICGQSLTIATLDEALRFPEMLLWLKQGHEFHEANDLKECLFCGNSVTSERKATLAAALDDRINQFISRLSKTSERLREVVTALGNLEESAPVSDVLVPEVRSGFGELRRELVSVSRQARAQLNALSGLLDQKQALPASPIDNSAFPLESDFSAVSDGLARAVGAVNATIAKHNETVDNFAKNQEEAEIAIRKHFLAESREEYRGYAEVLQKADTELADADTALKNSITAADTLRKKIRAHGPAAESINRLIASYLGHNELSIFPLDQGYELRRHGRAIAGMPSEGEKTAIAISYFVSSIEAEGRKLKDTIVVVDDPVSSLDTKALNFACSLIRSRLEGAGQLFVLTHNQQCINEFRKAWKNKIKAPEGKEPTATFLFMDVVIPQRQNRRRTRIVEMPRLLREYDSEYHYLFGHVLKFTDDPSAYYEHGYMMPNVLRRVLDVFLAFKCPGNSGLPGQIAKLCVDYPELDKDRLVALERLAQVESHSDNLDDLLSFSSMTLEETQDAAGALLAMVEQVDSKHLAGVKRLCR